MRDELFDVVDADDRVVGQAPRSEVHARKLSHRAVHILIHDAAGRLFLQKRSLSKDTFPGCWDSSCSGHVDAGENYVQAAWRELGEELGWHDLSPPLRPLLKLASSPITGFEFIEVFSLGPVAGPFTLHPEEISEGRWVEPAELTAWLAAEPAAFASALRHLWTERREEILARISTRSEG